MHDHAILLMMMSHRVLQQSLSLVCYICTAGRAPDRAYQLALTMRLNIYEMIFSVQSKCRDGENAHY